MKNMYILQDEDEWEDACSLHQIQLQCLVYATKDECGRVTIDCMVMCWFMVEIKKKKSIDIYSKLWMKFSGFEPKILCMS